MESDRAVSHGGEVRRTQRLKSISESSTNDSGYSSEVFTSPEFSKGSWNLGIPADSSIKGCLVFDGPATRTRLASTPLNNSTVKKGQDFVFPSPELDVIKKSCLSRDSAIDVVSVLDTDESELEIISKKISENSLNIIKGRKQSVRSQGKTKCSDSAKAPVFELPIVKPFARSRKPLNILVRILKEADYLIYEILKHLSSEDLINVSQVSRQLRNIILGNKELSNRRLFLITKTKSERERIGKENLKLKRLNEGAGTSFGKLSPRKQLGEIQNLTTSNERKAPASVSCPPSSLSDKFIEEGKKLPQGEELQKCVKCKAPAKVYKTTLRAVCSSESCGYDYCTRCCLPSHRKAQECSVLKPRTRNGAGLFSMKCKKNLRRL